MALRFRWTRPPGPSRTVVLVYGLTVAGTALWLAAIFLAPYLASRSSPSAAFLYRVFAPVCHQIPSRCFYLRGFPLAVCGRCLGVYGGFLVGLALYPFVRGLSRPALPPVRLFLLLSLPIGIDSLANLLSVWPTPIGLRFATGLVWGAILPAYFLTGVVELITWARGRGLAKAGRKKVELKDRASEEQP